MALICYRKSDLRLVGTVPDNIEPKQEIQLNVIPNFGGTIDDYAFIETDELHFHLELIDGEITIVKDERPIEINPPTLEEQLSEKDKQILLLQAQNNALTERTDFHEEILTEIILTIAP